MTEIKVCVVAAFEPLRLGLAGIVGAAPDMAVVEEASSLTEVAGSGALRDTDVILVDSGIMEGVSARDAYIRINEWLPALRMLFLGGPNDVRNLSADDVALYMKLSTVGFVLKDAPSDRVLEAIRLVAGGTFVCEMDLIRHVLTRLTHWASDRGEDSRAGQLSDRETEVLALVARGSSNKEIAQELFLSKGTVKAHISHIMAKVGAERRADLVRFAVSSGIVPLSDEGFTNQ